MEIPTIHNFKDFYIALQLAGFSTAGDNGEGIFSLQNHTSPAIVWHTDEPETDPWTWRIRAISEYSDVAYGKVFLKKNGWITRKWYPYFIAVRRAARSCDELYNEGKLSRLERDIYDMIKKGTASAVHDIKSITGDKTTESALIRLQILLLITLDGQTRKLSKNGVPYGWPVSSFCTVEEFFTNELQEEAELLSCDEAEVMIRNQILCLNPQASEANIKRFIDRC
ncbi:MAG TPA: hypothetical protein VFF80_08065 [Bacillota bacterium]|nr:hypothetical protein [Bacillota bacterium]